MIADGFESIVVQGTKPSQIDGDPNTVRDLTVQQLVDVTNVYAELVEESIIQIRNAGMSDILSRRGRPPEDEVSGLLEEWQTTTEATILWVLQHRVASLLEIVRDVQNAAGTGLKAV